MTLDNGLDGVPAVAQPVVQPIFAGELPEGCPPATAAAGDVVFYAAHRDNPPSDFDFTTAFQRKAYKNSPECERKCNSVMADESHARHLLDAVPDRFKFVSRGHVQATHGVWEHSPAPGRESHHSLWLYVGVRMHDVFIEIL
jgi:hypothetical protein